MRFLVVALAICIGLVFSPKSHAADASTYKCTPGDPDASRFWVAMDSSGAALAWFCKRGNGWDGVGFYGHWDEIDGNWIQQTTELLQGSKVMREATWNARINKQPAGTNYDSLRVLFRQMIADNRAQYPAPTAPPVEVWEVQPIAAGTRPYGVPNSAGTGITKKGDVQTLTPCDGAVKINGTSYYAVPSKGTNMFALCRKKP